MPTTFNFSKNPYNLISAGIFKSEEDYKAQIKKFRFRWFKKEKQQMAERFDWVLAAEGKSLKSPKHEKLVLMKRDWESLLNRTAEKREGYYGRVYKRVEGPKSA